MLASDGAVPIMLMTQNLLLSSNQVDVTSVITLDEYNPSAAMTLPVKASRNLASLSRSREGKELR